jgi:UV DNA damage endonuclease
MQLATFNMKEADSRAVSNCKDLISIMEWNAKNDIKCFRVGSDLFPRMTCNKVGYQFTDLPSINTIEKLLGIAGKIAWDNDIHLSMHPGPYTTLASPTSNFRDAAVRELKMHEGVALLLDPYKKQHIPINIHIGGTYDNYEETANRFIETFKSLSPYLKSNLSLENDDKKNGWSVRRLYDFIHKHTNIPICFDLHHWLFCHDEFTIEDDFILAKSTWGNKNMQVHYSQSSLKEKVIPAHSNYYDAPLPEWLMKYDNFHVHLECKAKEKALIQYRLQFQKYSDRQNKAA